MAFLNATKSSALVTSLGAVGTATRLVKGVAQNGEVEAAHIELS